MQRAWRVQLAHVCYQARAKRVEAPTHILATAKMMLRAGVKPAVSVEAIGTGTWHISIGS